MDMLQVPAVYGGQVSANNQRNSQTTTVYMYRDNFILNFLQSLCVSQVSINKNSRRLLCTKLFVQPFIIAPFNYMYLM